MSVSQKRQILPTSRILRTVVKLGDGDVVIGQAASREDNTFALCFKQAREKHVVGETVESYTGFEHVADSDVAILFKSKDDVCTLIRNLHRIKASMPN